MHTHGLCVSSDSSFGYSSAVLVRSDQTQVSRNSIFALSISGPKKRLPSDMVSKPSGSSASKTVPLLVPGSLLSESGMERLQKYTVCALEAGMADTKSVMFLLLGSAIAEEMADQKIVPADKIDIVAEG